MAKYRAVSWLLLGALIVSGCSYIPSWAGGKGKPVERLEGERFAALPDDETTGADGRVSADLPYRMPPALVNTSWRQHSGNVTASTANLAVGGVFDKIQSATIGDGEDFISALVIPPVVADGLVFAMDASGYVSAHHADNINEVRWRSEGVYEEDAPVSFGGGLAYYDGVLYMASGRGQVAALEASTGHLIWRRSLKLPFRSAPRVGHGKLYLGTLDNQLYALNIANGSVVWTHRGISETADIMNSYSPVLVGEKLVVPYSSGELYMLSVTDGLEVWSDTLNAGSVMASSAVFSGIGGDPVVDGEVVFVTTTSGVFTVFHVESGRRAWVRNIGSLNTPWVAGDYVYVLTDDNRLLCLMKYSGVVRWSVKLRSFEDEEDKEDPIIWKGPVVVDGAAVVIGSNGQMVRVDARDGRMLATQDIPEDIYTSPVVAGSAIYVVGQDATLYSLE